MFIGKRIKKFREKLEMSQQKLADLLGVSRQAVSQIEKGARKIYLEELIKLSEIFSITTDSLLNEDMEPEVILEKSDKRKKTAKNKIRISVPQKNVEKFKEILLYILNKVGSKANIGETVIYKLLYFSDFNFYEKYEEQLIGATYQKNRFGPTLIEFKKIVSEMIRDKEVIKIEDNHHGYSQKKYISLRKADLSKLRANEVEVVDNVVAILSNMNATQISEYSHNDIPWLTTNDGEIIDYEAVFYRTPQYSVRNYESGI